MKGSSAPRRTSPGPTCRGTDAESPPRVAGALAFKPSSISYCASRGIFDNGRLINPRYIINFPTKRHWRGKSRIADIRSGLKALIDDVRRLNISSIAVPPLGCGLGGLDWGEVRPLIEKAFSELPDARVLLYEPSGTPNAKSMPVGTARPHMTPARALFVKLMDAYAALEYSRTLLEVQKLAYFLQEAGEPLRLKYEAGHYGPYAANLNKVLEVMEGHFIRGYGDSQKPDAEIELLPGAVEEATTFLTGKSDSLASRPGRLPDRGVRDSLWNGASGHNPLGGPPGRPNERCSGIRRRPSDRADTRMEC